MADNISRPIAGLVTDVSPVDQPKGSYRFALNAVDNSLGGDQTKLSNELGHRVISKLSEGHILVGHINMTQDRIVLFSANPGSGDSEIGVLENDSYSVAVNDKFSMNRLHFSVSRQISGIYRLRRGCQDTIYFVDGSFVRYFNFAKPEDFKVDNLWDADLFRLQRTLKKVPNFSSVTIEDGGNIPPGSYSASIQFLDEDLNPTEWITSTDTVIVYQDRNNKPFEDIRGTQVFVQGETTPVSIDKAIRFNLTNLDTSFPYYRIGIVEASSSMGSISRVLASQPIPTEISTYLFTGSGTTEITYEELQVFDDIIESAEHIKAVDNLLILANTKGKQVDYCKLQSFASRIKVDCITEDVALNDINSINNPKRGTVHLEKVGYQPGELYALGIVYVFKDGTTSPVNHIPGKNPISKGRSYIPGAIPMSIDNEVEGTYTSSNNNCLETPYWGVDVEGTVLSETTKVRHHRFPTRAEANIGFVKTKTIETEGSRVRTINLTFKTRFKQSTLAPEPSIMFELTYYIGGQPQVKELIVEKFSLGVNEYMTLEMGIVVDQTIDSETADGRVTNFRLSAKGEKDDGTVDVIDDDLRDVRVLLVDGGVDNFIDKTYTAKIMGLALSDIRKPSVEEIGEEVIGYYIVRCKRDEYNKTILDSGVLLPMIEDSYYTAFGQVRPSNTFSQLTVKNESGASLWLKNIRQATGFYKSKIKKDAYALIHPQFLFNKKEYPTAKLRIDGCFGTYGSNVYMNHQYTEDVMAGTSYDSERNKKRERDSDGFSLHTFTRYSALDYISRTASSIGVKDIFYLDTLFGKTIQDSADKTKEIYNLSADNKIGVVLTDTAEDHFVNDTYPYVTMHRDLAGAYSDFRVLDYYKDSKVMHTFDEDPVIFSGDSYISPMTFTSSMYYNIRIRKRKSKKSFGKFLLGAVLITAGIVAGILTAGAGAALSLMAASAILGAAGTAASLGFSTLAAGFKQAQANKVYNELYDKGLKDCVDDKITSELFDNMNPPDDEVQWMMDSLGNLWFESQINMNWRNGVEILQTDFLPSPSNYNAAEMSEYLINKVTVFDKDNSEGKLYQGFANPEIYDINRDYMQRNWTKFYSMLGIEYDCCSDCQEDFPHRVRYSQQSFQEELTDNYRKFLPNNYRDIDGETGEITNVFTIGSNLYLHTEDALWLVPRNYQERVTDQIVSFLGTGSFFSVPPQRIVDSDFGISAGLQHKWASVKTPAGYAYFSHREGKLYLFNGQQTQPISLGISKDVQILTEGMSENNPLNPEVGGYVLGYDPNYNRIMFTKLDAQNPDKSFTLSYSIDLKVMRSYHSYTPGTYLTTTTSQYLLYPGQGEVYKTATGKYQTYKNKKEPFILDFISVSNPVVQREWNAIRLDTEVYTQDDILEEAITFNKAWLYNTYQSSGLLNLKVDEQSQNSMWLEVVNTNDNSIFVTRDNSSWHFNDFRDIVVDKRKPVITKTHVYPELNSDNLSYAKPWYEQDNFKDKWLGVRLIYDRPEDVKILTNYIVENEQQQF